MSQNEEFGAKVRRVRKEKDITLRKFAEKVELSPTFISKMERGQFKPPSEIKVIAIANALGLDVDETLALAGRVSKDLADIIMDNPQAIATFLRTAKNMSAEEFEQMTKNLPKQDGIG